MTAFDELTGAVHEALARMAHAGQLPPDLDLARVTVDPPRDPAFGDAATNAAMVLAKAARQKPLPLAQNLALALAGQGPIVAAEAAPPGFVNLRVDAGFWQRRVAEAIAAGRDYGRCDLGRGRPVNVEFCSANPTGSLHVGHGRGTVVGDALSSLLTRAGWQVTREYYVNDGGGQIDALARTIHHRYREALGEAAGPLPDGLYPSKELLPVAEAIAARDGRAWLGRPEADWLEPFGREAVTAMLARIREDLALLGVRHDVFTSERTLIEGGTIERVLAGLERAGLVYEGTLPPPKGKLSEDWEATPQLLFKSSAFGDDSDRALRRTGGAWTYLAADMAYHADKHARGFARMVDIWGADHGGYVKRMQAAVTATTGGDGALEVLLCQLVNLLDGGQPLKMSKRAGRIVTLRDVVEEVGVGAFRFMMLTRKNDAPLDFDLVKVREQSKDNAVFYVQYAHARIRSVFRNAAELDPPLFDGRDAVALADPTWLAAAPVALLDDPDELALLKHMALYPRVLQGAAEHREPHRIAFYLYDLASVFHGLWTKGRERPELRFLVPGDAPRTRARLAMIEAVRTALAAGLDVIGVEPVEEMH